MGRAKIKLMPEKREQLRELMRKSKRPQDKERLQAALLACGGEHTIEEIAEVVARAKSAVQKWLDKWRNGGVEELLRRGKAPGKEPLLNAQERQLLEQKLRESKTRSVVELQRWLRELTGKSFVYSTVHSWVGKAGAVMRVPRPCHIKKDPQAAMEFRATLEARLGAVPVAAGKKVRVWVTDEGRFGLHSFTRKVWTLRGVRPVAPTQQKYSWEYVYGALECSSGAAEFAYLPTVTQEASGMFLEQISRSEPDAEHIVLQDGAGFHLRPGDPRLPGNVHMIDLPPYSPELNPVEKLWDVVKDAVCNQAIESISALRKKLTTSLRNFWEQPETTLRLMGRNWLTQTVNAICPSKIPFFK